MVQDLSKIKTRFLFENWKTLFIMSKGTQIFILSKLRADLFEQELIKRNEVEYLKKVDEIKKGIR